MDTFLDDGSKDNLDNIAAKYSMNQQALGALRNRLQRLNRFDFLQSGSGNESVKQILDYLDRGIHVVLEFGRYGDNLAAYMLVAIVLTRRIHQRYVARNEAALAGGGNEPRPLVITIEEAHNFLGPAISSQTIFGTIAREMRKYNVTLLVVDQRPSDIDEEVMSQIGTKVSCLLDSARDVDSVLYVYSSPAIGSDGTVYVGSQDNKLYAIKTDSKGLAKSPWPMRGQNARHTGRTK